MVLCNNWRNPALLAKMAATLDVISEGRLELGIGAGWNKEEHETYGYFFPEPRARVERLKEGVEIIKKMWTEEKPSYKGKHYWIREAICDPKPVQKPHPPIMIGGAGEQFTLKVVASCADRWNFGGDIEQYKHKLGILEKYCRQIGRNPKDIEKTCFASMDVHRDKEDFLQVMEEVYGKDYDGRPVTQSIPFEEWLEKFKTRAVVGTPEECLKRIRELTDVGITYFIFRSARQIPNLKKMRESLQVFAEDVISQIRNN
jgi:alkanesulfonate monooxygenase SsuD/methylene tetrahydromethanopterin reductase-like flavin-dependent oxidoreductase (luciferase family)